MAIQRRIKRIHAIEVTLVWLALIAILTVALMFLNFSPAYVAEHWQFVVIGVWTTIALCLISIAIATILALLGALGRMSANPIANGISGFYISIIRGTPLLIQIYLIYLGLPQIGSQFRALGYDQLADLFTLTAFQSGVLALSLNYGAYMTEIFRAGIQSVHKGQMEAARSLGMTYMQAMRHVIVPQALRVVLPPVGNEFIMLIKDTSLVSAVAVADLTRRGREFMAAHFNPIEVWTMVALLYLILTLFSARFIAWLENRRRFER